MNADTLRQWYPEQCAIIDELTGIRAVVERVEKLATSLEAAAATETPPVAAVLTETAQRIRNAVKEDGDA